MVVADYLTMFGFFLVASFSGYTWGTWERAASDFINEAMQ